MICESTGSERATSLFSAIESPAVSPIKAATRETRRRSPAFMLPALFPIEFPGFICFRRIYLPRLRSASHCQQRRQADVSRQAAFLEFPAAAARTRIVPANFPLGVDHRPSLPQHRLLTDVLTFFDWFLGSKAVPTRQFLYGVAEQAVLPARLPGQGGWIVDRLLKVLLEVMEPKPSVTDQVAREGLLHERPEFDEAKQRNGALPALPNPTFFLRFDLVVTRPQKPCRFGPRHFTVQRRHRDRFEHARPDVFVRFRVQNHLIQRLRIAVENGSHDAMGSLGDSAAKYLIEVIGRTAQQTCERPIRRFLAPLTEQMKDEEERIPRGAIAVRRHVLLDRVYEDRSQARPVCACGAERLDRQWFLIDQAIENLSSVHAFLRESRTHQCRERN